MQDASFVEATAIAATSELRVRTRAAMILLGYIPLFHVAASLAIFSAALPLSLEIAIALFTLFIAPPLLARMAAVRPGTFRPGDAGFLRWWLTNQLQVVFNRLPLEEILRLMPGLYSLWLRLWGARVGALVYWSPRVIILDRGLVRIGDGVVVGAGARLSGHMLERAPDGALRLVVAPVSIESRAVVGAWTLMAPGARVAEGESLPATMGLAPFRTWSGGRRLRGRDAL